MKKIIILMTAFLFTLGLSAGQKSPASQLLKRMKKLQKRGIMIGHQDDPVYGHTWKWEMGHSDVKDICGDYPAVMGFELGSIEIGKKENLDGVSFERMRQEIIAQYQRGGICTLSWHPWNPVTGKNAWDPSGQPVKSLIPGGVNHKKFDEMLGIVANFIGSLKTDDGKLIPIIFRPWHEMSGGWFWWGCNSCTPAEYKQLYQYTHDKLSKDFALNNIVWSYSPGGGVDDYLKYYPGDKYVDMLGTDIYDFDANDQKYTENIKHELSNITAIGKQHHKIVALTETGAQRLPNAQWFTQVFWPVASQFPISYVLFWRNAWDNPKELYISYPGHSTEKDFLEFSKLKRTLFVNDIK
ncbi:MAG: glycoside hydrolase family 26 protein [Prevotella sp.]|jgi:mannan endo-1,4-beta-mannosidase|nr:glycoside hydrolase family 26 protein [Prevotella sp.]